MHDFRKHFHCLIIHGAKQLSWVSNGSQEGNFRVFNSFFRIGWLFSVLKFMTLRTIALCLKATSYAKFVTILLEAQRQSFDFFTID